MRALSLRWTLSGSCRLVSVLLLLAACASDQGSEPDGSTHAAAEASVDGAQDPAVSSDGATPRDASSDAAPVAQAGLDAAVALDAQGASDTATSVADSSTPTLDASDAAVASDTQPFRTDASATDAGENDAAARVRCLPGSRELVGINAGSWHGYSVLTDDDAIYWPQQNADAGSGPVARARDDILMLPRAVIFDPRLPREPVTLSTQDYAFEDAVSGDDGYLYFIGLPMSDGLSQGLYRMAKRKDAPVERLPVEPGGDYWAGPLALDQTYFYLTALGNGSRTLRVLRIARVGYAREELWYDNSPNNDSSAIGSFSLHQADIALDADHVYFTLRINQNGAPHDYRVLRLNKSGRRQIAVEVTTLNNTYGGLASDGTHLFFSSDDELQQWTLATGQREMLAKGGEILKLSYHAGVLSWHPTQFPNYGALQFLCL